MASESNGIKRKPHNILKQVTILVDRGASGNYFDDHLILDPKLDILHYIDLTVLTRL